MQVALVQLDIAWEDRGENFRRVNALLDEAPPPLRALVVLPEMFATGFSLELDRIAEPADGQTARFVSSLAKDRGVHVIAGMVERSDTGRGLNRAIIANPEGRITARYAKTHPFTAGGEGACIDRGSEVIVTNIGGVPVSPFVCYDLRFPEVFRTAVRLGAEVFAVIANWPSARESHWVTLLMARAIENQAFVLGVNRCGSDPKYAYTGRSMVIDPRGKIIADAGGAQGVTSATLNMESLREWRTQFPALADMHPGFVPGNLRVPTPRP
ncbi:MAG: carbon-nitrogen family hydrolase [Planctomycetes bacterium]|nr:carbon-nitrogen family hydrolase [Planctomycetota bacterium]